MMHFRNRFLAGSLVVLMAVSSIQYPAGNVRAEELREITETGTDVEEDGNEEEQVPESAVGTEESDAKETGTVTGETGSGEEEVSVSADSTEESTEKNTETATESTEAVETTEEAKNTVTESEGEGQDETSGMEETEEESQTEEVTLESEDAEETEEILSASEGDNIASGSYENITWCIDANGKLTAEGTGELHDCYDYYSDWSAPPWYNYRTSIKSAEINIKDIKDIGRMFDGCTKLTEIDLRGLDTSKATNMRFMFRECSTLAEINLSKLDTSSVTDMGGMFSRCWSLREINLGGLNTSNVTGLGSIFSGCSSLTEINLSGLDTSKVTNMSSMFSECSSLTSLDVSGFKTENVEDMSSMFSGCHSLAKLDLSLFTINSTQNVDGMFYECTGLKEIVNPARVDVDVNLPVGDTSSWRRNDGTKVTGNKLLQNLPAVETISRGRIFGISFQGQNFTLAEEKYQSIEFRDGIPEEVEIVDKGAKTPYTFTITADEGYAIKSVRVCWPLPYEPKIKLTKGVLSDQYIVTPLDETEGYVRDELIEVEVVPETEYELLFESDNSYDIAGIVVINESTVSEKSGTFSIKASNKRDITIGIKAVNREADKVYVPMLRICHYNLGTPIESEQNIDTMSDEEKEYFQKGYSIFRIRPFEDTKFTYSAETRCKIKFVEKGFPDEVHIYEYNFKSDENQELEEYTSKEILTYYSEEFYIQVKWADTPERYNKWCKPQISFKEGDLVRVQEPMEAAGGDVWRIHPQRNMEVLTELMPHKIELVDFNENNIMDLQIVDNPHAHYDIVEEEVKDNYGNVVEKVTKRYVSVYGGDSLTLTVKLDDGLDTLSAWADNPNLSTTKNADGTYTISVKDMSKILELTTINLGTYDPQNRILLSDLNMNVPLKFNGVKWGNPVYTGKPIKPQMPTDIEATYSGGGVWKKITLSEKIDYTWTCENNINSGEAFIVITAVPSSTKYRGETRIPFTIEKAKAPDNQEKTEYVETLQGQNVFEINLSEKFAIDHLNEKNVVPIAYNMEYCDKGGVLAEDSMPVIEGDKLTYTLHSGADKNSNPATIVFEATYQNYYSCQFILTIKIVKREIIVLGGTVMVPNKIYDGIESVPDLSGLKVVSKEGITLSEVDALELLEKIYGTMKYHYVGVGDTKYDSERPPVDVGTYKIQTRVADSNIDYKSDYLEGGTFCISQREVTLRADDVVLCINDTIPTEYTYSVDNLAEGDMINAAAFVTCEELNTTETEGEYSIIVSTAEVKIANLFNKDVTSNYIVSGKNGKLAVRQPKAGTFTVTYKCTNPRNLDYVIIRSGFESGSLIEPPNPPSAEGMIFLGWYRDEALTTAWNFDTDIVQSNITLYAGWMKMPQQETNMVLCVQEILPQTYTGKAIKPTVTVFFKQNGENKRLQINNDYKVEYKNNINADTNIFTNGEIPKGGIGENVNDAEHGFDKNLPYVIITGKGSYTGKLFVNFHIRAADISKAEEEGSGFSLKYADQLDARDSKYAAVVTQFKYKNKTLKCNIDYELASQKQNGAALFNNKGQILLEAGEYALTITGRGNFTGEIRKQLYIADKSKLMKNARITCQRTVSNLAQQELIDGVQPRDLVVKLGDGILVKDTDYTVECINNHGIGTATVIVSAKQQSGYIGSKSVTFNIKGTTFKEKVLQSLNLPDKAYTGRAVTLNFRGEKPDLVLTTTEGRYLEYGKDYIVSYKNNIKKGKAAITFKALPASGYSGSFSKKFNITSMDIQIAVANGEITMVNAERTDSGWYLCERQRYRKAGVTPSDAFSLVLNANDSVLVDGKDYTISYTKNKEVGTGASMTLKGKGNYEGNINVSFDITTASLSQLYNEGLITVTSKPVVNGG